MSSDSMSAELSWLPLEPEWENDLAALKDVREPGAAWARLQRLAKCRLDYVQTGRLDRVAEAVRREGLLTEPSVRVALLGSSTLKHLASSVRVAAMRRGNCTSAAARGAAKRLHRLRATPAPRPAMMSLTRSSK